MGYDRGMDYRFFYFSLSTIWLLVWSLLFWMRKDIRKEMLTISLLFGIGGIISEFSYIRDWWRPFTLTRTLIGVEDFIFGFAVGGICSVLYEEIYHKRLRRVPHNPKRDNRYIFSTFLILWFGSNLFLNTFYSSVITIGISTLENPKFLLTLRLFATIMSGEHSSNPRLESEILVSRSN